MPFFSLEFRFRGRTITAQDNSAKASFSAANPRAKRVKGWEGGETLSLSAFPVPVREKTLGKKIAARARRGRF